VFNYLQQGFGLDLDSTVFQRSGQQEEAAKGYDPRRAGHKTQQPLLADFGCRADAAILAAGETQEHACISGALRCVALCA
jgi:hypothetical protein